MARFLAASLLGLALTVSPAMAADENSGAVIAPAVTAAAAALAQGPDLAARMRVARGQQPFLDQHRPLALPALYASSAILQGYDAYSTLGALKSGATEANPMMKAVTKSPVAFIGLKAGMATVSILAAERMWKSGNRIGAVATMVASNAFMGYVASNNARVLSQARQ